jgi:hypothetical protein
MRAVNEDLYKLNVKRAEELTNFYWKHDPSKVEKVSRLFEKFSFEDIRTSVKRKYGELPPGWDDEGMQLRSKVDSSSKVRHQQSPIAPANPFNCSTQRATWSLTSM